MSGPKLANFLTFTQCRKKGIDEEVRPFHVICIIKYVFVGIQHLYLFLISAFHIEEVVILLSHFLFTSLFTLAFLGCIE
jgi:hypothetical protein